MRKEIQKRGSQAEELMSSSAELNFTGSSTEWGVVLQGVLPGGSPWGASTGWGAVLQGIRGSSMGVFLGGSTQAGVLLGVCHAVFHVGVLHWVLPGGAPRKSPWILQEIVQNLFQSYLAEKQRNFRYL